MLIYLEIILGLGLFALATYQWLRANNFENESKQRGEIIRQKDMEITKLANENSNYYWRLRGVDLAKDDEVLEWQEFD